MDFICPIFLCGILAVCISYWYIKRKQNYWLQYNIPFVEISSLFDSLRWWNKPEERLPETLASIYSKYKGQTPMVGLLFHLNPVVLAVDLDFIRKILIADFHHFQNRGFFYNEKDDPLSANLLRIDHHKWKPLRSKLTPMLTSNKVKFMFPTMLTVANELVECLNNAVETDSEVEIYEWMGRFTTDIIGTCTFGIDCNCLRDPDDTFRRMGKKASTQPRRSMPVEILLNYFKPIAKSMGICVQHKDVSDFFSRIVTETIAYREENNVERNDLMTLLMKLKNSENEEERMTVNEIAAQSMDFFFAGFETSANALNFCINELAMDYNKTIQDEVRREILTVLEKYNGELCHEALSEMKYVDRVINGMEYC